MLWNWAKCFRRFLHNIAVGETEVQFDWSLIVVEINDNAGKDSLTNADCSFSLAGAFMAEHQDMHWEIYYIVQKT